MIITNIKIKNYKTYLSLDLDLTVKEDRPIILIGGMNGGGKTTLFEAICGALYEYMQLEENKAKRLHGGIIVKDKYGNWVWSPFPLDLQLGTHDTTNWEIFDPQKFI